MSRFGRLAAGSVGVALALGGSSAMAAEGSMVAVGSGALQLIMAIIQLAVSLTIVAFTITRGFALLTNLLNKAGQSLNIWQEIKNRNLAVAMMGAGVVISYCNVIGSGVGAMSNVLGNLVHQSLAQSIVGLLSAVVNIVVAIAVASFAITVVFKVMDRLTTDIDEVKELKANNTAIGVVYAGLIIGVSFLVSSGVTSIGMGVNALLSAVLGMIGLG
jgi:uncharacterized membrane protein YjfL (UPF0719 family)